MELTTQESRLLVTIDGRSAEREGNKLTRQMRRLESQGERLTNQMSRLTRGLGGLALGLLSVFGARGGLNVITEFERLSGQLQTVTRDVELAGKAFEALEGFASTTPFTLDQSVSAYIKLRNLGIVPTERALISFGNTATAQGKDLNQFIEAVADASTFEFERLKEFGIKARQESDSIALTFQGTTTRIGKNSDEIVEYLTQIGENNFAGAMERQVERLPGILSNTQDAIERVFRTIGQNGATSFIGETAKRLTAFLNRFSDNYAANLKRLQTLTAEAFAPLQDGLDTILMLLGTINTEQGRVGEAFNRGFIATVLRGTVVIREGIKLFTGELLERIGSSSRRAGGLVEIATAKMQRYWLGLGNFVAKVWDSIRLAAATALDAVELKASNSLAKIADAFENIPGLDNVVASLREYSSALADSATSSDELIADSMQRQAFADAEVAAIDKTIDAIKLRNRTISETATGNIAALRNDAKAAIGAFDATEQLASATRDLEVSSVKARVSIDDVNAALDTGSDRATELSASYINARDSLLDLLGNLDPAVRQTLELRAAQETLTAAYKQGVVPLEEYEALQTQLPALLAQTEDASYLTGVAIEEAFKRVESSGASLFRGLIDGSTDALDFVKNLFLQTLAELAYAATIQPILIQFGTSVLGQSGGGLSGLANRILSGGGTGVGTLPAGIASPSDVGGTVPPTSGSATPPLQGPVRPGEAPLGTPTPSNLSRGFTGAGTGAFIGGLASLIPGGGNTGALLGGTAGGIIGEFVPVIGPILGSVIGSVLGKIFGSVFSKSPRVIFGSDSQGITVNDKTDRSVDTDLGTFDFALRKFKREDADNFAASIESVANAIAEAAGPDRRADVAAALDNFYYREKGKNIDLNDALEDFFNTALNGVEPEIAAAVRSFGGDLADRVQRLADLVAISDAEAAGGGGSVGAGELEFNQVLSVLNDLADSGETIIQTYNRLAQQAEAVRVATEEAGIALDVPREQFIRISDSIADKFGGSSELLAAVNAFVQNTVTAAEQEANALSDARASIDEFIQSAEGLTDSTGLSRQQLLEYTRGLDLTTEAGQEAFAAALKVSEAVAFIEDYEKALTLAGETFDSSVAILEQFRDEGEALSDTFTRVTASIQLASDLIDALGLTAVTGAEDLAKIGDELVKLAGGQAELSRITSEYTRIVGDSVVPLSEHRSNLDEFNKTIEALGYSAISDVDGLRDFVQGLDLTTEAGRELFVQATRLAPAAKAVSDANAEAVEAEMARLAAIEETTRAMDEQRARLDEFINTPSRDVFDDQSALLNRSSYDVLTDAEASVRAAADAFDGSLSSLTTLADASEAYFVAQIEYAKALTQAGENIRSNLDSLRTSISEFGLSNEELYNARQDEARRLFDSLDELTDPAEIERTTARIRDIVGEAWGLLDEGQRARLQEGFLAFIDSVQERADMRLSELEQNAGASEAALQEDVSEVLKAQELLDRLDAYHSSAIEAVEGIRESAGDVTSATADMASTAELIAEIVKTQADTNTQLVQTLAESVSDAVVDATTSTGEAVATAIGNIQIIITPADQSLIGGG